MVSFTCRIKVLSTVLSKQPFYFLFFLSACSNFNPFNDKIETTSDGSYVIETGMTDQELLQYGQTVVYRFKSVPNMVAVKNIEVGKNQHKIIYDKNIYSLPSQNKRIRPDLSPSQDELPLPAPSCVSSYCEANFDKLNSEIFAKKFI